MQALRERFACITFTAVLLADRSFIEDRVRNSSFSLLGRAGDLSRRWTDQWFGDQDFALRNSLSPLLSRGRGLTWQLYVVVVLLDLFAASFRDKGLMGSHCSVIEPKHHGAQHECIRGKYTGNKRQTASLAWQSLCVFSLSTSCISQGQTFDKDSRQLDVIFSNAILSLQILWILVYRDFRFPSIYLQFLLCRNALMNSTAKQEMCNWMKCSNLEPQTTRTNQSETGTAGAASSLH